MFSEIYVLLMFISSYSRLRNKTEKSKLVKIYCFHRLTTANKPYYRYKYYRNCKNSIQQDIYVDVKFSVDIKFID